MYETALHNPRHNFPSIVIIIFVEESKSGKASLFLLSSDSLHMKGPGSFSALYLLLLLLQERERERERQELRCNVNKPLKNMGTFFVLSFSSFFTQQRRLFDVSLSLICNEDLYARTGRKSNFSFCFEHPSICSCRVRQLRCWHRFSVKQAAKLLHFAGSVKR